jgi:tetratricopeptide (TPR) repeat protein
MNQDGVLEIITMRGDLRWHPVEIFSWNGTEFLLLNVPDEPWQSFACSDLYGHDSQVYIEDTNGNGWLELVLIQGIPIGTEHVEGLPWRPEIRICAWNEDRFAVIDYRIDGPPEYRFQAVQDGDRAVIAGDYDQALQMYREAIENKQLEWWSWDRFLYEMNAESSLEGIRPTLVPTLRPDPQEYPNLAAYARYRIMLLHILRGDPAEAQASYDKLRLDFPGGKPGYAHAEMAVAFWTAYQRSSDIGQACAQAVKYAAEHPDEILAYLGNNDYNKWHFGSQSLVYTPEDVCPFP